MCAERLRLFVAADIPREHRDSIACALEPLKEKVPGARWVKPDNLHLTVKFIGEYGEDGLERLSNEIEAAAGRCAPFVACLGRCGAFPSPGKARVLWVGMERGEEEAAVVARRLDARLERAGVRREGRGYRGHLTVARLKTPADCGAFLEELAARMEEAGGLAFEVEKLTLYRSILSPSGPTYVALRRFALGGEGRGED